MAHIQREREKILARIKRIQGQLKSVSEGVETDKDCNSLLQTLAAARGALNSLTAEILEDHIRDHVIPENSKWTKEHASAAEMAIEVIKSYMN